jgi:putative ABC transport system permease protein
MVIGTASLILVVTIGITGRQYVLHQIEGIGVDWVFAEYAGDAQVSKGTPDPLTLDDMKAVLRQVPGIVAASPVVPLQFGIGVAGGRHRNIQVLGVTPDYERVRNLVLISGWFLDGEDLRARNKVGVLTDQMARQLYGSVELAIGQVIKIADLPFTVIGTFKARVETFGGSAVTVNTMVVPVTVSRFFADNDSVKQLYFSVGSPDLVVPTTGKIKTHCLPRLNHCKTRLMTCPYSQKLLIEILQVEW